MNNLQKMTTEMFFNTDNAFDNDNDMVVVDSIIYSLLTCFFYLITFDINLIYLELVCNCVIIRVIDICFSQLLDIVRILQQVILQFIQYQCKNLCSLDQEARTVIVMRSCFT